MNARLRMYQVMLFKFGRHLCKGSMRHEVCELATREAKAFRSAAVLNIYAVRTGSEFVTSSQLKISGFDRPHDSKFILCVFKTFRRFSRRLSGFKSLAII